MVKGEVYMQRLAYDGCEKNPSHPCKCCRSRKVVAAAGLEEMRAEWNAKPESEAKDE